MKMSNTRPAIGALIAVVLSLGATAVGSSAVYAKGHPVHSLLPRGAYAQAIGLTPTEANRQRAEAESWGAYQLPTDAQGDVVNYTDYQRGGSN
jgi:hypothetical protein